MEAVAENFVDVIKQVPIDSFCHQYYDALMNDGYSCSLTSRREHCVVLSDGYQYSFYDENVEIQPRNVDGDYEWN